IDDYINAKKLAVEKLVKDNFTDLIAKSGFERVKTGTKTDNFRRPILNQTYMVMLERNGMLSVIADPLDDT
ncbi:hypothetical protein QUF75_06005, partial [Desulfococcaceae bacterium HSG7]|nr:hypothetical protein [Desulfococcaceae bacterium HSG7]